MDQDKKFIWEITVKELLYVLAFYLVFAIIYDLTIAWNMYGNNMEVDLFTASLKNFPRMLVDYALKLILTIPIWILMFRTLRNRPLWIKVLLHIPICIAFIIVWQALFYWFCDLIDWFHLKGAGSVWDLYIPALFYMLQFGIFHAYASQKRVLREQARQAELREAATQSELNALKAQLNPHFLYNVFNTINASLPPEQEATREMIAQLSDMFRYQVKASRHELVPLRDELDFVSKYLELEQARFGDRLQVEIMVPEALKGREVPPLILQPLVENAIKHGIAPQIEGGTIQLKIWEEAGKLHFRITDTGAGVEALEQVWGKGLGLTNTRIRLEKMFQSALKVRSNQPQRFVVEFSL